MRSREPRDKFLLFFIPADKVHLLYLDKIEQYIFSGSDYSDLNF